MENLIEKYVPKKYQEAVVEIHKDMDGWWAYLSEGYTSTDTECGTIHEYTIADLKKKFKTIVKEEPTSSAVAAYKKLVSKATKIELPERINLMEAASPLIVEDAAKWEEIMEATGAAYIARDFGDEGFNEIARLLIKVGAVKVIS